MVGQLRPVISFPHVFFLSWWIIWRCGLKTIQYRRQMCYITNGTSPVHPCLEWEERNLIVKGPKGPTAKRAN